MNLSKSKITIIIGCLLFLFFALSLLFRVALPYDSVFTGDWVKFTSNDAYHIMRYVDNMVHNFPHVTQFDPYFIFPPGLQNTISGTHFFDWLLAVIIWIIGLGSPTQHTIDTVGVYFPAVLAALTVIPVFFIGKALFNRWVGVMAAFLTAIMPGEFLGRSILGFAEVHIAETLFSTLAVLFLILAIKAAGAKQDGQPSMTLGHLMKRDRKAITGPLVYSLLAGIFLGIYLITWMGAMLFVFIIALYLLIQFMVNHLRHKSSDHLGIIGFIVFLVAFIIFLPLSTDRNLSLAMGAAVLVPLVLTGFSRLFTKWGLKTVYYPLSLIGVAIVFLGIFYAIGPETVSRLWTYFVSVFAPGGGSMAKTTIEMQTFLSPYGRFSTAIPWGQFTTSFFLFTKWPVPGFAFISFVILFWLSIKQRGEKEPHSFFIIWTLVILIATLVQRRFAYYLVINVVLLSAYISWQIIWFTGLRRLAEKPEKGPERERVEKAKARARKKQSAGQGLGMYYVNTILAIIIVLFFVCFWNITKSAEVASNTPYAPSDGWEESLNWMKNNTPEPLGDPDAYDKLFKGDYKYPESAYGVTAWWDYGYWISRTAHRIPSANPSQDPKPITKVANLFLSKDEASANKIMAELESSYIITDYDIALGKLWAVVDWAGQEQNKYFSLYYISSQGTLKPVQVYNPDYYRSFVVRLYNFNGKAVTSEKPIVVTYIEKVQNGINYRQITNADEYPSYKAAQDYIASQKSGKYDIIGADPFVSPVPLEAVQGYKLVYSSMYSVSFSANTTMSEIKIFQRLK